MSTFIGLTGPSSFTTQCVSMIEEYFSAVPLLLYADDTEHLDTLVGMCSAVILAGGVDIHPSVYGEPLRIGQGLSSFDRTRDTRESYIVTVCIENKLPILGICRGHQLLGALNGCEIKMDLANYYAAHSPAKSGIEPDIAHSVVLTPEGHGMFGKPSRWWVNSYHHQGVIACPTGVRSLGVCPDPKGADVIELMDCPSQRWVSCQWHPEIDYSTNPASSEVLGHFASLIA